VNVLVRAALVLLMGLGAALAAGQLREEWFDRGEPPQTCTARSREPWSFSAPDARVLARWADSEPDGAKRVVCLRAALAANPRFVYAWIGLGLALEQNAPDEAERSLLEAARLDRQLLPAWTLANFYFRQDNHPEFWQWAARAAARTYDDYRPLLVLGDRLEKNPQALLENLSAGPELTRVYLDFLIGAGRLEAAQRAARALLHFGDPADRERILSLASRQSAAGRLKDAEELQLAVATLE